MYNRQDFKLSELENKIVVPNDASTIAYGFRGLNWKGKLGFFVSIEWYKFKIRKFYRKALREKRCFYGPFKGEFGHFLLHNLPFLVHLHKQGVAIHYCGMELHKPFLIDESGNSIIAKWYPLRDFFAESKPNANETVLPPDVKKEVEKFQEEAKIRKAAYLDISENDLYWYVFRNWQLEGKQSHYDLSKVYGPKLGKTCVIFPRKKGETWSSNNGGPWDYTELAKAVSPFFERVFLVGHPSFSASVQTGGNIELKVSNNNADTLKYCAESDLIITQHSGAVHLGSYLNVPVLIIFTGKLPIKGLTDTIRFRKNIAKLPLNYAFNLDEIKTFVCKNAE